MQRSLYGLFLCCYEYRTRDLFFLRIHIVSQASTGLKLSIRRLAFYTRQPALALSPIVVTIGYRGGGELSSSSLSILSGAGAIRYAREAIQTK